MATELTDEEKKKYQFPPGGRWWQGKGSQNSLALPHYHSNAEESLIFAWDQTASSKMYGVYTSSPETFVQNLLDVPRNYRFCYELIVNDEKCCAYLDIEWEAPLEEGAAKIAMIVKSIREKIKNVYKINAELYLCCSSRPLSEEIFKHSYHIVVRNLVYACNHDGMMKSFFTSITEGKDESKTPPTSEKFEWIVDQTTIPKKTKPMIDGSVYTMNRIFRLPGCIKKEGANVPFIRISGDPFADDLTAVWDERDYQNAILPFLVSKPAVIAGVTCLVCSPAPQAPLAAVGTKRPRSTTEKAVGVVDVAQKKLPAPRETVQKLLNQCGDTSNLGIEQYLSGENKWKLQGTKVDGRRKCLICPNGTTIHKKNQCIVFVEPSQISEGGSLKVLYHCKGYECNSEPKALLGYLYFDPDRCEWRINYKFKKQTRRAAAVQPRAAPVEADAEEMQLDDPGAEKMQLDDADAAGGDDDDTLPTPKKHDYDDPESNTYPIVKRRFEEEPGLERFVVRKPKCYYGEMSGDDAPTLYSYRETCHAFPSLTYWEKNEKGVWTKRFFIEKWLKDPHQKTFWCMTIEPDGCPPTMLNLWRGFIAAKLPPVTDEVVKEGIKPFITHIHDVWANGDQTQTDWILEYLANIVQRPGHKTQVAILLFGKQGCGKGVLLSFLRTSVLGLHCTGQTSDMELDLFGKFSNCAYNKVLIQADEVGLIHGLDDKLKNFITEDMLRYEKKGKDAGKVRNFTNLILTTNNKYTLKLAGDDRRNALFHCSDIHSAANDPEYSPNLQVYLNSESTARIVYQYLMGVDLEKYKGGNGKTATTFERTKPQTKFYNEYKQICMPTLSRFISGLVNNDTGTLSSAADETIVSDEPICPPVIVEIVYKRLLQKYIDYYSTASNDAKNAPNSTTLGQDLKKYSEIKMHRYNNRIAYRFDFVKVKQQLVALNEYDDTVFISRE